MAPSKMEVEVEMKSESDQVWNSIKDLPDVFPKALSHRYKSIEVLEGDGKSAGSIRLITYQPDLQYKPAKEKVEKVDEANKTLSYSVIEGNVLQFYKNFKGNYNVISKGDHDGSVMKWWCEFDKASDQVPDPDALRDFAIQNFKGLDAYILNNH